MFQIVIALPEAPYRQQVIECTFYHEKRKDTRSSHLKRMRRYNQQDLQYSQYKLNSNLKENLLERLANVSHLMEFQKDICKE